MEKLYRVQINKNGAPNFSTAVEVEPRRVDWIDKAISIIDDMQREGIVDYEQAREFRMRAKIKGVDDEHDK